METNKKRNGLREVGFLFATYKEMNQFHVFNSLMPSTDIPIVPCPSLNLLYTRSIPSLLSSYNATIYSHLNQ